MPSVTTYRRWSRSIASNIGIEIEPEDFGSG